MTLVRRLAAMTVIFGLIAGPLEAQNWMLGAILSLPVAFAIGGLRRSSPAKLLRMVFLPWFLFGVVLRAASGAAQMVWLLLVRRDWKAVDFVTCPAPTDSADGRNLLGMAETTSPGSIVVSAEDDFIISTIKADRPEKQCRELRNWHRRFQRPMTG